MGSHGITDKVAIVGMACTKFGEHWGMGTDDLVLQAAEGAFDSAGVGRADVDAYWLGTAQSGMSGLAAGPAAAREGQAGHPRRELLRVGIGGAAPGGLRGVERCL